ncbi:MAG TPA: tol-pal system protein YbgF [Thermoanaerobaculia bacterium]|nr:tol-pal system protein YbgF [Thermoanaerobaculia bacterium]
MVARRGFSRALSFAGGAALALAAGGCVSTSDIEGLRSQISDVQRQVLQVQKQGSSKEEVSSLEASIGKQMGSLLKTEADMQVKLQDLSAQLEALQAKLEDTNFRLTQLSQQIAATNQELKGFRGARPESDAAPGAAPPAAGPAPSPAAGSNGGDPQSLYNAAYSDYTKGSYDLAMRGFQQYVESFPNTPLAANATYWIGECYYRQRRYRQAIEQYDTVINRFLRSDKMASALLKKGYAHLELGERSQGVVQLRHVLRQFPTSDEANLARQRLREIGIDAR